MCCGRASDLWSGSLIIDSCQLSNVEPHDWPTRRREDLVQKERDKRTWEEEKESDGHQEGQVRDYQDGVSDLDSTVW